MQQRRSRSFMLLVNRSHNHHQSTPARLRWPYTVLRTDKLRRKPTTQNSSQDLFGCVVCLHVVLLLREDDVEDSVGAAAGLVHVGCSHSAGKKEGVFFLVFFTEHCSTDRNIQVPTHRALFPESIRSWMSLYEVTASLERSST